MEYQKTVNVSVDNSLMPHLTTLRCWIFRRQCTMAILIAHPLLLGVREFPSTLTFN